MDIHDLGIAGYEGFISPNISKPMDYKPFIPSSIGTPKSYEEEFKLNIGDIVAKKKVLDTSISNRYKVVVTTTINGQYGIVPVCSPFDLPMYFYREELVLIESANKEKSFLYQVGDVVSFKLSGQKDVRYGQIKELLSATTNFYKIKDLKEACLYLIEESNIERIASTIHESNSIETSNKAEPLSAAKSLEDIGKIIDSINEEKPLNIKIAKKQIKLNFKN